MAEFDICRWRTEEEQEGVRAAQLSRGIPNYGIESIDLSQLMNIGDVDYDLSNLSDFNIRLTGELIE